MIATTVEQVGEHVAETMATTATGGLIIWARAKLHGRRNRRLVADRARIAKEKEMDTKLELLTRALVTVLHDRVYGLCDECLSNGYISTAKLDNLNYLMSGYEALGGNGTGHILYEKTMKLPINDDNEPESIKKAFGTQAQEDA
ncbi:hypothetical protein [Lacticaseibacillus pantheris]|uniref:hypothetical protein n=1 Tax=Lacticaseibacillus pantheris TaxID=171523 RepID=UPI0026583C8A|nr:hypothetical protein [Lacticaseibacillus pantheris]WKF86036.1 hypothetical protein QY874_05500 [Lacticaseibacillus pantheris]